jgi:hypothetical protein
LPSLRQDALRQLRVLFSLGVHRYASHLRQFPKGAMDSIVRALTQFQESIN